MTPEQRKVLIVMGVICLFFGGWIWLYFSLISNPETTETLTTDLQQTLNDNDEPSIDPQPSRWTSSSLNSQTTTSTPPAPLPDQPLDHDANTKKPLVVLLPPRFGKSQKRELFDRINTVLQTETTLIQPTTRDAYTQAIQTMTTSKRRPDIMLLPWSYHAIVSPRSASLQRQTPPTQLFHPQLQGVLTHPSGAMIPYMLDPRVTLSTPSITVPKDASLAFRINQPSPTPLQIDASTLDLLRDNQSPRPRWSTLIARRINQLATTDNNQLFTTLFKQQPSTSTCIDKSKCLIGNQDRSYLWLPLSTIQEYDIGHHGLLMTAIPSLDKTIPTDLWWWMIHNEQDGLTDRLRRIQTYLQFVDTDQLPYHTPLLPARRSRLDRIVQQDQWSFLRDRINNLTLISTSPEKDLHRLMQKKFADTVEGNFHPTIFLQQRNESKDGTSAP